jgi:hypothetical protein
MPKRPVAVDGGLITRKQVIEPVQAAEPVTPRPEPTAPVREPTVGLTVKVTESLYTRLATLRMKTRKSHQAIAVEALERYLDAEGA